MKKTCVKSIAKQRYASCFKVAVVSMAIGVAGLLHAADGTWTNTTGGVWSGTTNWLGGTVAGGMDSTGYFDQIDIAGTVLNLDIPVSIGSLVFADTDTASGSWINILNNGSETNTLQVTNVVVNSFADGTGAAIYSVLKGSGALVKSGAGRLAVVNTNTYSGGTVVEEGFLQVGNGGTTGGVGSGPLSLASGTEAFFTFNSTATVRPPAGSNISGEGSLSVQAGRIWLDGDITLGGDISMTQNSGGGRANGVYLMTDSVVTASSIAISADIGQENTALWDMVLDTSSVNGPVDLDISLGRNGYWYPFNSFTVNAGTGPITFSGGRLGVAGGGFRKTPTTLTGAVNIPVNLYSEVPFTINATTNSSISGVVYGSGGSIIKSGPGSLTVSSHNTYTGPTVVKEGTLVLGQPAVNGAARHFDASNLGLANGDPVTQWDDLSSNGAHATVPTSNSNVAPTYIADAGTGTGLGALNFLRNAGAGASSALWFTRDSSIRSVFSIFKGSSFLLTDNTSSGQTYHFHRPTDGNPADPLWVSYTSANIRNGQTYVNGVLTNGLTYNMPVDQHNGYNLIEVITTGNVTADSFNKDRYTIHAGDQSHAEMIIFDRALSETERLDTEAYLNKKWFGIGEGAGDTLPTSTELILEGSAILDMSAIQRQTVGSLTALGGTEIVLNDATLTVSGDGRICGTISGDGGSLVKQGSGTLNLQVAASYGGATIVTGGVLQVVNIDVPSTNPVPGAARWFDASALSLTNGEQVAQWDDLSGNNAHAVNTSGTRVPVYETDAVNGLGAVYCDRPGENGSGHYLVFNRDTSIRTVFSIFKGSSFLLTDDSTYHFHRGGSYDFNPADQLWLNNGNALAKNADSYVNGQPVNGLSDAMPVIYNNGFNLIEVVSDANLTANSFNRDRVTIHCGDQYHGEVILYNRKLSEEERLAVERYLMRKWFGYAYSGSLPDAPVVLGGGATLDPGGTSATLGTLTMVGNGTIALGDGSTSLSFDDSSSESWNGTLTLTGTLGSQTLRFGTDSYGLTKDQLAAISLDGREYTLDGNGYLQIKVPGTLLLLQ